MPLSAAPPHLFVKLGTAAISQIDAYGLASYFNDFVDISDISIDKTVTRLPLIDDYSHFCIASQYYRCRWTSIRDCRLSAGSAASFQFDDMPLQDFAHDF